MSYVAHVCAYLVCPACLEPAFHERCIAEAFHHAVVRNGRLSNVGAGWEYCHAQAVFRVASYVSFYAPFVFREVCPYEGDVAAVGCLVEELQSEFRLGFGRLGNHEQSAGVFVYAVHQSDLRIVGVECLVVLHVPCYGVDERAREVAAAWMYDHSGRLVDHHEFRVFVDDVERYVFGVYR